MTYQVLALKYRPKTFDEVVGQKAVVRTLQNSIASGRIAHAYLFSGVRGVGKTTVARLLAKSLNCEKGPAVEPCNACAACSEIAASSSLDVLEIDGASNNSVDDVRELRETVRYSPNRDRYRIFIIDEVHMLSNSAFNALLKTLEEPPPHVVFLFATTEYRKIPVTILSRCQHFEFRRIPRGEIAAHLGRICASEKVAITPYALDLIARLADGSLRDAQSTLDQVIAYCGSEVRDEEARSVLGVLDRDLLLAFAAKVSEKDPAGLLDVVDRVLESGNDPALFLNHLMELTRNLLLLKILPDDPDRIGLARDDAEAMAPLAAKFSQEDLLRILELLAREEPRLKYTQQPRYLLEALAVRLCHLADLTPLEELIARFAPEAGPTAPAARPSGRDASPGADRSPGPSASRRDNPAPPVVAADPPDVQETLSLQPVPEIAPPLPVLAEARGSEEPPDPRRQVEAILERIHSMPGALGGFLSHASFFAMEGDAFVISLPEDKAVFRSSIERKDYLSAIRKAVEAVTGRRGDVRIRIGPPTGGGGGAAAPRAGPAARKQELIREASRSPVVQSVLEIFHGEITDVEET
jgi:DNA polymerase-3 subunit gamma/tau